MKPVLLLSGADRDRTNYEAAVAAADGNPRSFYLPAADDRGYDGLILCGGGDLEPSRFGQYDAGSRDIDPRRDEAELTLISRFLAAGKPILGICRGIQVLNVALGGDLIQDLPPHVRPNHTSGGRGDLLHPTCTAPDSFLHRLYGPSPTVNSAHHQAAGELGRGLTAVQWSGDGCVEAVSHVSRPVWGVQWHPERLCLNHANPDAVDGLALFHFFVAVCGG